MSSAPDRATLPDLVVLSFLAERPMHGYELNQELIRCEVEDWAGISRPQVYYSLRKLHQRRWLREVRDAEPAAGPERRVYAVTAAGHEELSRALDGDDWATQRPPPPFMTWLALAHHAPRAVRRRVLERRRQFLRAEIDKERRTLVAIRQDTGTRVEIAALMVEQVIQQFELELDWLGQVARVLQVAP
jgi:DNA-binding PadR family transcriptional regulator